MYNVAPAYLLYQASNYLEKPKKFLGSIVGKALLGLGLATAVETVGLAAGKALPELTIGASLGAKIADRIVPTEDAPTEERSIVATFNARPTQWKVACVATTLLIAGGINWAIARMSGSEDGSATALVAPIVLSTAGSILGGMESLRLTSAPIPENYTQRTLQYFAADATVNYARGFFPTLYPLSYLTGLIGSTTAITAGTIAYNAQNIAPYYQAMKQGPHEIVRTAITSNYGSFPNLCGEVFAASGCGAALLGRVLESPVPMNFLARCFNDFADIIRSNSEVLFAIENFKRASQNNQICPAAKEALIEEIKAQLGYRFNLISLVMEPKIEQMINDFVDQVPNLETALVGFPLSDPNDLVGSELRKIYLTLFFTYVAAKLPSLPRARPLERGEIHAFYSNAARLAISGVYPEAMPNRLQGAVIEVLDAAVDQILPAPEGQKPSFWRSLLSRMRKSLSPIWALFSKTFFFMRCRQDDAL